MHFRIVSSNKYYLVHQINMGIGGQRHVSAALRPGIRSGTHCVGGLVGTKTGLDGRGKSRPQPGFDPRTVQPIRSHYTD
jgi:hypothetical protein